MVRYLAWPRAGANELIANAMAAPERVAQPAYRKRERHGIATPAKN